MKEKQYTIEFHQWKQVAHYIIPNEKVNMQNHKIQ